MRFALILRSRLRLLMQIDQTTSIKSNIPAYPSLKRPYSQSTSFVRTAMDSESPESSRFPTASPQRPRKAAKVDLLNVPDNRLPSSQDASKSPATPSQHRMRNPPKIELVTVNDSHFPRSSHHKAGGSSRSSRGSNRGKDSKHPSQSRASQRTILESPARDVSYIQQTFKIGDVQSSLEENPKNALSNFSVVVLDKTLSFKTSEGYLGNEKFSRYGYRLLNAMSYHSYLIVGHQSLCKPNLPLSAKGTQKTGRRLKSSRLFLLCIS